MFVNIQGSLWNCVHPSTLNKSQPWARVQLNLVQLLAGIVLNVQAFDPDGAVLNADGRTKW